MHVCRVCDVPKIETNARKIVAPAGKGRVVNIGGGSHDRFVNDEQPDTMIAVPRHKELSPGVARSIAKAAGWI